MSFLTLEENLKVGVSEIDDDHKRMVDMVIALHNSMIAGMSDECFAGLFDSLIDCTAVHFRHEEELMEQSQFPFAERHRREHETLLRQLALFREDIVDRSNPSRAQDMMGFLKSWLVDHIVGEDKELGFYLQARKRGAAA